MRRQPELPRRRRRAACGSRRTGLIALSAVVRSRGSGACRFRCRGAAGSRARGGRCGRGGGLAGGVRRTGRNVDLVHGSSDSEPACGEHDECSHTAATTPTLDERRVAVFSSSVGSASNGVEKAGTGAGLRDGSAGITAVAAAGTCESLASTARAAGADAAHDAGSASAITGTRSSADSSSATRGMDELPPARTT